MKNILTLIILLFFCEYINSQNDQRSQISLNTLLMSPMLDQNQDLRKLDILMDSKQKGLFDQQRFAIGASIIGIMDYQKANVESKFGYLMRHPTANNQRSTTVTEAALHSVQVGIAGSVNS